jgi:broad-specificity NMP kinase
MNFGNSGAEASRGNVGAVEPYIVWEYANVVNAKLKSTGVKGWCVAENFRAELLPEVDWVAVAHCGVGAGLILNLFDKQVIVHNYEHSDEETLKDVVKTVAEKLNFPKRYTCEFHTVNGYEDVGLLHWLSRVVWGEGA